MEGPLVVEKDAEFLIPLFKLYSSQREGFKSLLISLSPNLEWLLWSRLQECAGEEEKGGWESTFISVPWCSAQCCQVWMGCSLIYPSHQSTDGFSPQLLTAGMVQAPHPHTAFPYSCLLFSGNSHSSKTQWPAGGNSTFGQHKNKYIFVSPSIRLSWKDLQAHGLECLSHAQLGASRFYLWKIKKPTIQRGWFVGQAGRNVTTVVSVHWERLQYYRYVI